MDTENYIKMTTAGTITLSYVDGDNFQITKHNFNYDPTTNTATEIKPTITQYSISKLTQDNADQQAKTASDIEVRNQIISDAQALQA